MTGISISTVEGDRVLFYKGRQLKLFCKYDDFAFTKASDYLKELRRMTEEEFREIYPEFFL